MWTKDKNIEYIFMQAETKILLWLLYLKGDVKDIDPGLYLKTSLNFYSSFKD
jgi:hypothetical protein